MARKLRKKYKKQKCKYVDQFGKRCKKFAVGKSTLCATHGGDKIDKNNLIPTNDITDLMLKRTKYEPSIHPIQFMQMSKAGFSDVEIAAEFEVSTGTLYSWAEKFEDFNFAYETGRAMYESWWLEKGKDNLTNTRFNTSLYKFLTGNKLGFSDKMESKTHNTNVHGVLVIPSPVSTDEWSKRVMESEDETMDAEFTDV